MVTVHVLSKIFWIIKWTLRWFVFLVTLSAVDHEVLQPPTRVTEFLMSNCLLVKSNGGDCTPLTSDPREIEQVSLASRIHNIGQLTHGNTMPEFQMSLNRTSPSDL